jgi:ribonuclease VapC
MYIDASALAAIVKGEPERQSFIETIKNSPGCITSAVSVFDAAIAFSLLTRNCTAAVREIDTFLTRSEIEIVPIDESALIEMALARDRYGKGTGHPAQLNLGDCISYAMAKTAGVPLLYKGNDFARTDLA